MDPSYDHVVVYAVGVCRQDADAGGAAAAAGEADAGTDEAGTTPSPADDDLALRAALYGLVIQSHIDKVRLRLSSATFCPCPFVTASRAAVSGVAV